MDVEKVPKVIYACAVLYNIYLSLQLIDLDDLFEGQALVSEVDGDDATESGFQIREAIVTYINRRMI